MKVEGRLKDEGRMLKDEGLRLKRVLRPNKQTFVIVELLLRLKKLIDKEGRTKLNDKGS